MRSARVSAQLGLRVQPCRREFSDRLEHQQAGVRAAHPPNQTLVDERAQPVEDVDLVQALDPARHVFHGLEPCAGEHREELEQTLLARIEHLVAPVDRVPQRLLPDGCVARSTSQQLQPIPESLDERLR